MQRTLITSLTLLMMAVASWLPAQDAKVYQASKVYTLIGPPLSPGQVYVADGKIQSIGETVIAENAEVIDLGPGSVIMPGLVDAYSQTPLASGSSDEVTSEVTPEFQAAAAVDWRKPQLKRLLGEGTTTVQVCPGTENVIGGTAAIIKTDPAQRVWLSESSALVGSLCNDPASGNRSRARPDSIYVRQPTNRMGVVWIWRNSLNKAQNSDSEKWQPVVQSLAGKRPLMLVSRRSFDLQTVATLADEFSFSPIIVGGQESHLAMDMLRERKYPVVLRMLPSEALTGSEGSELCWNQAGVLREAGVPIAISGDRQLDQARFAHRFGLSQEDALAAITLTPAELLGVADRVGSLAPGKDADLLVLSGEPLELTTRIQRILVNGKSIPLN